MTERFLVLPQTSDGLAVVASVGLLHQIHESRRLDIPGAELAAGRLYHSQTWLDSIAPGGVSRTSRGISQWSIKSRHYGNLDDVAELIGIVASMADWEWRQVNLNTFASVWPPESERTQASGSPGNMAALIYSWADTYWDVIRFDIGMTVLGGHADSFASDGFRLRGRNLSWQHSFHGADLVRMNNSGPRWRSKDWESTPISSHGYGYRDWAKLMGRAALWSGASADGPGGPWMIYDRALGDEPQTDATALRIAPFYFFDPRLSGLGMVGGETGSNYTGAGNSPRTGALAYSLRDWYAEPANVSTFTVGGTLQYPNIGWAAMTTENGYDVGYYLARDWVYRTEFRTTNWRDDVHTRVGGGSSPVALSDGTAAFDPVRKLLVHRNNSSTQPCVVFIDAKRPNGGSNPWLTATLSGPDLAEFLTQTSNRYSGQKYCPLRQSILIYCKGRQVWEMVPAATGGDGFTPQTGWTVAKLPMFDGPFPEDIVTGSSYITGTVGLFEWCEGIDVLSLVHKPSDGEWWILKPPGWQNPLTR